VRDPALGRFRLVRGYFRTTGPARRADHRLSPAESWPRAAALLRSVGELRAPYEVVADPAADGSR
jgi:hypothetical protein